MIEKEEVKHIAQLARIKLTEEEIQKMREELVRILEYVEQLKEVDIENLEPTSHSVYLKNVFREDKPLNFEDKELLIENAPQKEGRFIKTKAIFK